jgi:hypothetical protein
MEIKLKDSPEDVPKPPPYGAYRTFWNFILSLAEHPLPQVIDNSVMGTRGGSAKSELYGALRFFDLIDAAKRPTPTLHGLVGNPTADQMRELVLTHYQPVIALGLETATPRQVDEVLQKLGTSGGTTAKARTFFIHAAQDLGIEVGRTLATSRAPTTTRRRRAPRAKSGSANQAPKETAPTAPTLPTLIQGLIERLPPNGEEWQADDALQWLEIARPALAFAYGFKYPEVEKSS